MRMLANRILWTMAALLLPIQAQQQDADAEYKRAYEFLQQMRPAEAIAPFQRSATLNEAGGNLSRASIAWNNLGVAYSYLGETALAIEAFEKALHLRERIKDRFGQALTLSGIASVEWRRGEFQRAIELYQRSLGLFTEEKAVPQQADTLSNLGLVYADIGDEAAARQRYAEALKLWRAAKNRPGEARTLNNLGMLSSGVQPLTQALAIFDELKDNRSRSYVLHNLGDAYTAAGQLAKAAAAYKTSLAIKREVGDRSGVAFTLTSQARLALRQDHPDQAATLLEEALAIWRDIEDRNGEAVALADMAYTQRALNNLPQAAESAGAALALIESSRAELLAPNLRMSFLASRRDLYDLLTAIRMHQHAAAPEKGYSAMAFDANERGRARVLLDSLSRTDLEALPSSAALLNQQRRVRAAGANLSRLLIAGASGQREKDARQSLDQALSEYRQTLASLEAKGDPDIVLLRPNPLPLGRIQSSLPEDAALLVYAIGKESSYLWVARRTSLETHQLPKRAEIEPLIQTLQSAATAQTIVQDASREQRRQRLQRAAATLRTTADKLRKILIPAGLEAKRVFLVPDGPLDWVPFATLLPPDRFTLTWFPSATFAAREAVPPRPTAITVFADPVYPPTLPRLNATAREAAAIRAQFPRTRILSRYDATREAFLAATRTGSILHVAAHTLIDPLRPQVSGIAFSMLTPDSKPRDGLLRLGEIYSLHLDNSLVVLSSCESRAGKEFRGEGLASLAHGFLHAGARQVVASLWPVPDESSALFMEHFYREMFQTKRDPAEALRRAQLAVRKHPEFAAPFYWAGFAVEGN